MRLSIPAYATAVVMLALQIAASIGGTISESWDMPDKNVLQVWWHMLRYFTFIGNVIVLIVFGRMVVTGRAVSCAWATGTLLWILIVGLVWQFILGGAFSFADLGEWVETFYHIFSPPLVLIW